MWNNYAYCRTFTDFRSMKYIFTAGKRSLRRLCFYTCLSFCSQGEYLFQTGTSPAGTHPRQVPPGQVHPPRAGTPRWAGTSSPQVHQPPRQVPPSRYTPRQILRDTVNERAVCILLECILIL